MEACAGGGKTESQLEGKCHIRLNDDEIAKLEADAEEEESEVHTVVDSDDDDHEEKPALPPSPPKSPVKPKKRVVRKARKPALRRRAESRYITIALWRSNLTRVSDPIKTIVYSIPI